MSLRGRTVVAVALTLALSACGSSGEAETTATTEQPPAPPPQGRTGEPPRVGDGNGGVKLAKVGDFEEPIYVAQPASGGASGARDLYVVEKGGVVRVLREGELRGKPFLDISGQVSTGSEQGLLSIAFAPEYGKTGRFYVDYTDVKGDSRIVEYRRSAEDPLVADEGSAREVLFVDQPFENHNGGLVLFGPDGDLYIGFGDGGSAGDPRRNGQNLGTLLGKLLRIDPRPSRGRPYSVVPGNRIRPGARPEIFAYGLRNPWRFSFDRAEGSLWIGDVGQDSQEEIDVAHPGVTGGNFGWSAFEGTARYNEDETAPGAIPPVHTYGRDQGCSVTGGYVVRDRSLRSLYGRYLYGDYCEGQLRSFVPADDRARDDRALGVEVPAITSFGEDAAGRIYVTSQTGSVYRLDPAG